MKQIIMTALLLCAVGLGLSNAQQVKLTMYKGTGTSYSTITTQAIDTLLNTETTYFYTRAGAINKYTSGAFAVTFFADSIAGGTPTIAVSQQGSFDGVTWFALNGEALGNDGRNCDTLAATTPNNRTFMLSTVPKSSRFIYGSTRGSTAIHVPYYRISITSASTGTTYISNVKYCPFQL